MPARWPPSLLGMTGLVYFGECVTDVEVRLKVPSVNHVVNEVILQSHLHLYLVG